MVPMIVNSQERKTAVEVRADVQLIQQVMAAVMKESVHYGVIPGTKKPSLYKAGAEKLCSAFRIATKPEVEDLSVVDQYGEPSIIRYRLHMRGTSQMTGNFLGEGIGECSSSEERYKWRAAVCAEEWEQTPEHLRRIKFSKTWSRSGDDQIDKIQQVRTCPSDLGNTVLKMAAKRAMVDMTLKCTAASDVFAQDLEDLPSDLLDVLSDDKREQVVRTVKDPQARPAVASVPKSAPKAAAQAPQAATRAQPVRQGPPPPPPAPSGDGFLTGEIHEITSKKGKIQKGKRAGQEWEKWTIILTSGDQASTFNSSHVGCCKAAAQRGAEVSMRVTKTEYGYDIDEVEILEGPPVGAPQTQDIPPPTDEDAPDDEGSEAPAGF
jgi:hypothetical protein